MKIVLLQDYSTGHTKKVKRKKLNIIEFQELVCQNIQIKNCFLLKNFSI